MENSTLGTILTFAGPVFYQYQKIEDYSNPLEPYTETIFGFGMENGKILAQQGFLLCNGLAFSPHNPLLKDLYNIIGKCWGGSGSNSPIDYFRIPALEGLFLRAVSNKSNHDPESNQRVKLNTHDEISGYGNMDGSYQTDEFKSHNHTIIAKYDPGPNDANYSAYWSGGKTGTSNSAVYNAGVSSETRPRNAYVNYIIKASLSPINLETLQILQV